MKRLKHPTHESRILIRRIHRIKEPLHLLIIPITLLIRTSLIRNRKRTTPRQRTTKRSNRPSHTPKPMSTPTPSLDTTPAHDHQRAPNPEPSHHPPHQTRTRTNQGDHKRTTRPTPPTINNPKSTHTGNSAKPKNQYETSIHRSMTTPNPRALAPKHTNPTHPSPHSQEPPNRLLIPHSPKTNRYPNSTPSLNTPYYLPINSARDTPSPIASTETKTTMPTTPHHQ